MADHFPETELLGKLSMRRGLRPGDPTREYDYPMRGTGIETGYYARCLACLTIGPEQANSEAAREPLLLLASPRTLGPSIGADRGRGREMPVNQRVSDMAVGALTRQASTRSERTGEPFEEAFKAVLETEASRLA